MPGPGCDKCTEKCQDCKCSDQCKCSDCGCGGQADKSCNCKSSCNCCK